MSQNSLPVWGYRRGRSRRAFSSCATESDNSGLIGGRTTRATRLSVANYNTTLSSDSLESGTGSSNSLRSKLGINVTTLWRKRKDFAGLRSAGQGGAAFRLFPTE